MLLVDPATPNMLVNLFNSPDWRRDAARLERWSLNSDTPLIPSLFISASMIGPLTGSFSNPDISSLSIYPTLLVADPPLPNF